MDWFSHGNDYKDILQLPYGDITASILEWLLTVEQEGSGHVSKQLVQSEICIQAFYISEV
jgi:hypothetical protein